jgi:sensor histidine kinase YesM
MFENKKEKGIMKNYKQQNLKGKMLLILIPVFLCSFILASLFWYNTARANADDYLDNISKAYTNDAHSNFNYILTDTFHMITLITLNTKSIIEPVKEINKIPLDVVVLDINYIKNYRKVKEFITTMNGYKYYIVGIGISSLNGYGYQTSSILKNSNEIMQLVSDLDEEKLKTSMIMLSPMRVEGTWIKLKSDFVIPAVRGIMNPETQEIIGYVLLYFDYSLLETMFTNNLPNESLFQVTDKDENIIFSNTDKNFLSNQFSKKEYRYSQLKLKDVAWTLNIAIPNSIVMKNVNRTLVNTFLIMIPIVLLFSIILVLVVTSFSNRIKVISNTMKKVAETKQLVNIVEGKNKDELETIVHSYNEMTNEINSLMEQIKIDENHKAQQRIKLLQAQINPHFISNTLNTISWMAKKQNANNIVPLTDSINTLLRSLLKIDTQFITLEEEIEAVRSYINIMLVSGNYDFDVEYKIAENTKKLPVLRFIIQPIVENAILHGFREEDLLNQNTLIIESYTKDKTLFIEVCDNGKGMSENECKDLLNSTNKKKKTGINGIGCANVKERINLVYKEKASLSIESKKGEYTKVVYALDIETNDKTSWVY